MNNKKEIIAVDNSSCCGEIYFGYTNKKEVIKEMKLMMGEEDFKKTFDEDLLIKQKVIKTIKDGEDYYYVENECPYCGSKNCGVMSYTYLD